MSGSLIDVPGLAVGHCSLADTGVTVVRVTDPAGAVASGEVRGVGPGTRETDLLEPYNTVERTHAVVLSGGSAFGLAAADGVMDGLAERGIGVAPLGEEYPVRVPIVPAAVIFDLAVGAARRPGAREGREALENSFNNHEDARGSVGAGVAATAGRLRGGCGQAATTVFGYTVGAAMVANPAGEVVDSLTGRFYGDPSVASADPARLAQLASPDAQLNTTIGVVATDAPLTKAQARRLAMMAHDEIARAVRPAHSPWDGDTLFALSTAEQGSRPVPVATLIALGQAAADVVAAAIVDAVVQADPGGELAVTAYQELQ
ncbi:P1 family peptidase [Corynebacterium atypicum]|uniref:P1 family peptidase n=1 Tax=Corynebacterium atypicum TaxID=191610 RepID=UPI000571FBFD|nr:P1 family peptidase [Corynebacterium atypicum]